MGIQALVSERLCPSCQRPAGDFPLYCRACGRLFPEPPAFTYFDYFGLPKTYEIDGAELENRLLALTRRFHPDFFANRPKEQQELSLALSASLNVAHATLRDPIQRAEYLLRLHGGASVTEDKRTPKGFLEQMLFLREEIEEAKTARDKDALAVLHHQLLERRDKLIAELGSLFERFGQGNAKSEILGEVRLTLNASKYINGLVRDSAGERRPEHE